MKKTIEETRKRFAEKLIKEKNIDEDKAKLIAEKFPMNIRMSASRVLEEMRF
ncbi:MAG: hypothetical protein HYT94_05510 [Parcubacteria group bacterium]|nr:hypothetical protein [Parcubacteria group bacterium]